MVVFNLTNSNMTNINIDTVVQITNPSIVSITPLGTLEFTLYYNGIYIGNLTANNASLDEGVFLMSASGFLANGVDPNVTSELISRYLGGLSSPVSAQFSYGTIPLYENILIKTDLNTILPGASVNLIQKLTFNSLMMKPGNTHSPVNASSTIAIFPLLGHHSFLNIQQVSLNTSLVIEFLPF